MAQWVKILGQAASQGADVSGKAHVDGAHLSQTLCYGIASRLGARADGVEVPFYRCPQVGSRHGLQSESLVALQQGHSQRRGHKPSNGASAHHATACVGFAHIPAEQGRKTDRQTGGKPRMKREDDMKIKETVQL